MQNLYKRFAASGRKEVWGIRFEIAGLLLALGTALFQATITDWFPKYQQEAVAYSQESINIVLLESLKQVSSQLASDDPEFRKRSSDQVYEQTGRAINQMIRDHDHRRSVDRGQGSTFSNFRLALFAISGVLIIFGKYLVMRHKHEALASVGS